MSVLGNESVDRQRALAVVGEGAMSHCFDSVSKVVTSRRQVVWRVACSVGGAPSSPEYDSDDAKHTVEVSASSPSTR